MGLCQNKQHHFISWTKHKARNMAKANNGSNIASARARTHTEMPTKSNWFLIYEFNILLDAFGVAVSTAVVFLPFEFCFCFEHFDYYHIFNVWLKKTETLHRNVQMFSLDFPSGFSMRMGNGSSLHFKRSSARGRNGDSTYDGQKVFCWT